MDVFKKKMTEQQYALATLLFNEQTGLEQQLTEHRIRRDGVEFAGMSIEQIIAVAQACKGSDEHGNLTHLGRGEALNYLHGQRDREQWGEYGDV